MSEYGHMALCSQMEEVYEMEPTEVDDDCCPDHTSPHYLLPAQRHTYPVNHSSHTCQDCPTPAQRHTYPVNHSSHPCQDCPPSAQRHTYPVSHSSHTCNDCPPSVQRHTYPVNHSSHTCNDCPPSVQRHTYPVNQSSLPCHYSSVATHTASRTTSSFSPARAPAASTPQRLDSVPDLRRGHPAHIRSASHRGREGSCCANPMCLQMRTGKLQSEPASVNSSGDGDMTMTLEGSEACWMEASDLSEDLVKAVMHNKEAESEQGTVVKALIKKFLHSKEIAGPQEEVMKVTNIWTKRKKNLAAVPKSTSEQGTLVKAAPQRELQEDIMKMKNIRTNREKNRSTVPKSTSEQGTLVKAVAQRGPQEEVMKVTNIWTKRKKTLAAVPKSTSEQGTLVKAAPQRELQEDVMKMKNIRTNREKNRSTVPKSMSEQGTLVKAVAQRGPQEEVMKVTNIWTKRKKNLAAVPKSTSEQGTLVKAAPQRELQEDVMKMKNIRTNREKNHSTVPKSTSEQGTLVKAVAQRGPQEEVMKVKIIGTKRGKNCSTVPKSTCGRKGWLCVSVVPILVLAAVVLFWPCFLQEQYWMSFANVDTELLRREMASRVFGQHIALDVVPRRIEQYLATLHQKQVKENNRACIIPPLVLSLHGWSGGGKTFVSNIIMDAFSVNPNNKRVVSYHYSHQHLDEQYKYEVEKWILSNVRDYSLNLFVLDDMDSATLSVTQGIHNAFTKLRQENSCRSPVVVLLLSKAFGNRINKQVFEAMLNDENREQLSIEHFSSLFEDTGDVSWYQLLRSEITDTVPFLPLEKQYVAQCVHQDLVSKGLSANRVSRVLQELSFYRIPNGEEFSQTGCKGVGHKVNLVAYAGD